METNDQRNAFHLMPDTTGPVWRSFAPDELAAELAPTHSHLIVQPDPPRFGGMGAVYRALDSRNQRTVAIKIIRRDYVDSSAFTARFEREQKVLRSLSHPNIVRYYDSGTTRDGTPFIVMDWLDGRSLAEFTTRDSTRDAKTLLGYFRDACAAVAYAHSATVEGAATAGILHRDIKPANIIVVREKGNGATIERAIVLDWGIARSIDPARTAHTFTGEAPGTRGWLAPEVEAGAAPDHTADIYALGIIFYQLMMKRVPAGAAIRPSEEGLAPEYDAIFLKAAAPDKHDRYQSAGQLLEAVESIPHFKTAARPGPNRQAHTNPDPATHNAEVNDPNDQNMNQSSSPSTFSVNKLFAVMIMALAAVVSVAILKNGSLTKTFSSESSHPLSTSSFADKILGTWETRLSLPNGSSVESRETYSAGGVMNQAGVLDLNGKRKEFFVSGTWAIAGDQLTCTVKTSSLPEIFPIGYSETNKIIKIDAETMESEQPIAGVRIVSKRVATPDRDQGNVPQPAGEQPSLASKFRSIFGNHVPVEAAERAKEDMQAIEINLSEYQLDNGFVPSTDQGLQALVTRPTIEPVPSQWHRYMSQIPKDPWGKPYYYSAPAKGLKYSYDLYSAGADGKPGTADDVVNEHTN